VTGLRSTKDDKGATAPVPASAKKRMRWSVLKFFLGEKYSGLFGVFWTYENFFFFLKKDVYIVPL